MKVKLLLFPLSLVIALAVSIFWIQPTISSALSLRDQKAKEEQHLLEINRVVSNIDALDRNLNENMGNEQFVLTYLPKEGSDDRILDEINFLAGESGLLLVSTGLKSVSSEAATAISKQVQAAEEQAELKAVSPGSFVGTKSSSTAMTEFVVSSPSELVRSTEVSVSAFGTYEQIKAFVDRIYRANHFHSFLSVKVAERMVGENGASQVPGVSNASDVLNVSMKIRFGMLPPTKVSSGVLLKTFDQSVFDFSPVQTLRTRVTNELPLLDATASGRPNPFLR